MLLLGGLWLGLVSTISEQRSGRTGVSNGIKPGLPGSLDICQMLLLHNQATRTESVIIGPSHTTRFAHV